MKRKRTEDDVEGGPERKKVKLSLLKDIIEFLNLRVQHDDDKYFFDDEDFEETVESNNVQKLEVIFNYQFPKNSPVPEGFIKTVKKHSPEINISHAMPRRDLLNHTILQLLKEERRIRKAKEREMAKKQRVLHVREEKKQVQQLRERIERNLGSYIGIYIVFSFLSFWLFLILFAFPFPFASLFAPVFFFSMIVYACCVTDNMGIGWEKCFKKVGGTILMCGKGVIGCVIFLIVLYSLGVLWTAFYMLYM